jgi:hypothetical protein
MQAVKRAVIATASVGAILAVLSVSPAAATPVFTITPDAIPGESGLSPTQVTDINASSDSTINQTGASTQVENGWAFVQGFTNNGSPVAGSGLGIEDGGAPNTYGLYFKYTATVNGITGFSAGQSGTIAAGGFTATLYADVGDNDIFTAGATGPSGGTNPTVTDTGSSDVVLAEATSLYGSAGFQASTGAPTINAVLDFIICDGTANQGHLGGTVVTGGAATGCGTFDALTYFTNPNPFYQIALLSATAGSSNDLTVDATDHDATLNGVVADINFEVPEPGTLAMFGLGLIGLGWFMRRRGKIA